MSEIKRSGGVVVDGYIVGGGYSGLTEDLDAIVAKEAEVLRDYFKCDVTIRFNSDRMSGGAYLVDSKEDKVGSNCSIGLGARLFNSKIKSMTPGEVVGLSLEEMRDLIDHPDTLCYETTIDLNNTNHSVPEDSRFISAFGTEYRDFQSLDEAVEYLFAHVKGLKMPGLEDVIKDAEARATTGARVDSPFVQELQKLPDENDFGR